ncbi:transcriptional regulator [Elizabethkingia anophelis]|nr:transcriptional regulator [Elizabethkingia anophelis]
MTEKEKALLRFGMNFRKVRKSLGLSQDEVAANSERLIKATISDTENGKRNIELTTLLDLAKGIGKPPMLLLDYDHDCDITSEDLLNS